MKICNQARSSVADVYAHIIELLDQAENMYSKNDAGFIEGHASSGAAKALLAKVYATMASGAMSGVPVVVKGGKLPMRSHKQLRIQHRLWPDMRVLIRKSIMSWHVIRHGK